MPTARNFGRFISAIHEIKVVQSFGVRAGRRKDRQNMVATFWL
jgi:hypothetical protein